MRKLWQVLMTLVLCIGTVAMLQTAGVVYAETMTVEAGDSRENAAEITVGGIGEVTIENEGEEKWFKFTPEEDGAYCFYSTDNVGTNGESCNPGIVLFDDNLEEQNVLGSDASSGLANNFKLIKTLNEGQEYYFSVGIANTGSFLVHVKKMDWYLTSNVEELTVNPGDKITITADVEGVEGVADGLSYQWNTNSAGWIESANDSEYSFTPSVNDTYYCTVTDSDGNTQTVYYYISIDNQFFAYIDKPDSFSKEIAGDPGETVSLSVTAGSTDNELTYQWTKSVYDPENNIWLSEEELSETDSEISVSVNQKEYYRCTVADKYGNNQTVYFYLSVNNDLIANPKDGISELPVLKGDTVDLEVAASCTTGSPLYSWYRGEVSEENRIPDAESYKLTIDSVDESASYTCYVTDQYGNYAYVGFSVSVVNELTVVGGPRQSVTVAPGETSKLEVKVVTPDKDTPIKYEWRDYDKTLGHESVLNLSPLESGRCYTYYCTISQGDVSAEVEFQVNVSYNLSLITHSDMVPATLGEEVAIFVEASSEAPEGIHYSWYRGKTAEEEELISGANSPEYVFEFEGGTDYYTCLIEDGCDEILVTILVYDSAEVTAPSEKENAVVIKPGETKCIGTSEDGETWFEIDTEKGGNYSVDLSGNFNSFNVTMTDEDGNVIPKDETWNSYLLDSNKKYYFSVEYEQREGVHDENLAVMLRYANYQNSFYLENRTDEEDLCLEESTSVTLKAEYSYEKGSIGYEWQNEDGTPIAGTHVDNTTEHVITYEVGIVEKAKKYILKVWDEYGNESEVVFNISFKNNLVATAENENIETAKGETVNLKVNASCTSGNLTYAWEYCDKDSWENVEVEGATGNTYSFTAEEDVTYYAIVKDDCGNEETVYFNVDVYDTLELKPVTPLFDWEDDEPYVIGEDITLTVRPATTDSSPISYKWYKCKCELDEEELIPLEEETLIPDKTAETITVSAEYGWWRYHCVAKQGDVTADCYLRFRAASDLKVDCQYSYVAQTGENVTLSVVATSSFGQISYEWFVYDDEDGNYVALGKTGNSIEETVKEGETQYRCTVSDAYETDSEYITVYGENLNDFQEIKEGETKDVVITDGNNIYYIFVPAMSGYYRIWSSEYSNDPYAKLLDSNRQVICSNDDKEGSDDYNFEIEEYLEAGKKYYISLSTSEEESDDSYKVSVEFIPENDNEAAASEVAKTISSIPAADKLTLADKSAVVAARKAYDALTAEQQKLVPKETLQKLTKAEEKITALETAADNKTKADAAINAINALKPAASLTAADKAAVQAARKAYDALTADQKKLVSADTLKKLTDAEQKISDLEKAAAETKPADNGNNQAAADKTAADAAAQSITALKSADTVTLADKAAVEAARAAYDELTDTQKKLVPADTLKKLTDAEAKIAALEQEAANAVQKGKVYTVSNMNYKVTNADMKGKGTVTLTGTKIKKNKLKKLTVPAAVKINGASFKVTAIGNNAFKKFTKLGSVTIGANVTSIGNNAFANDSALIKVTIGKSVTKIGKAAFSGDKKLKSIIIKSAKLKSVGKKAINGIQKKATIKVPKKQLKKYKKLFKASTGFKKTMKIK